MFSDTNKCNCYTTLNNFSFLLGPQLTVTLKGLMCTRVFVFLITVCLSCLIKKHVILRAANGGSGPRILNLSI